MGLGFGNKGDLDYAFVGNKPVTVYQGSTKIWPPIRVGFITTDGVGIGAKHSPGDLLLAIAVNEAYVGPPELPVDSGTGTVPAWKTITKDAGPNGIGAEVLGMHLAYAVATSSAHTTGKWLSDADPSWPGAAGFSPILIFRGQAVSPIGAFSTTVSTEYSETPFDTTVNCPSVTLKNVTGKSALVHFSSCISDSETGVATGTVPAGYSDLSRGSDIEEQLRAGALFTKNVTTSDGAVFAHTVPATTTIGIAACSIEILF